MPAATRTSGRLPHPIAAHNVEFLQQGLDLLATLDDADYTRSFPPAFECGIGTHIRHIADHYDCFLRGLDSGRIDYDDRQRNTDIETQRAAGAEALRSTMAALHNIDDSMLPARLAVHMDSGGAHNGTKDWAETSPARELQFLLSHTVHHYALVAVILRLEGRAPADGFGVSPSTLRNRRVST